MKKPIVISVLIATVLLVWGFFTLSHAQDISKEEKPTFYRLVPGTYVNGWPRFTVTYPKDWVERIGSVFRGTVYVASSPGDAPHPAIIRVAVGPYPFPLDTWAGVLMKFYNSIGLKDVTLVSDKPSQLRDGTQARENEFRMVANTVPRTDMNLGTKKGDMLIFVCVQPLDAKIGEDLKAIPYSMEFQPEKDEPVKVPPDIEEFFDKHCSDVVSHDIAKVMTHFSDRYLDSGMKKGEVERFIRQSIGGMTSYNVVITELVPGDNKVYLTGFVVVNGVKFPLGGTSIIKENGEWKWYGNQRDATSDPRFQ